MNVPSYGRADWIRTTDLLNLGLTRRRKDRQIANSSCTVIRISRCSNFLLRRVSGRSC